MEIFKANNIIFSVGFLVKFCFMLFLVYSLYLFLFFLPFQKAPVEDRTHGSGTLGGQIRI